MVVGKIAGMGLSATYIDEYSIVQSLLKSLLMSSCRVDYFDG